VFVAITHYVFRVLVNIVYPSFFSRIAKNCSGAYKQSNPYTFPSTFFTSTRDSVFVNLFVKHIRYLRSQLRMAGRRAYFVLRRKYYVLSTVSQQIERFSCDMIRLSNHDGNYYRSGLLTIMIFKTLLEWWE
jgi:hypothetical protein